ncbi:MAG: aldo/keto reductase [Candidatus Methylomirabilota bacterium]
MGLPGYATPEGTDRFRQRFSGKVAEGHFRPAHGLWLSSVGLGTYLGNEDAGTDELYRDAVVRAVELGCNVVDSAINYRHQRSERAVGSALGALVRLGGAARDEVLVATKGGFLPFDGEYPSNPRSYIQETFIRPGIIRPGDLVAGCHCMAPAYLRHELASSQQNLGVDCVDIYYLHNPETQLQEVSRGEFAERLRHAFATLEEGVARGAIRMYGTATWNGYRQPPSARDYLSLSEDVALAREVGGRDHHLKVIQLPHNLGMPEALTRANQLLDGEWVSTLEAASRLGILVMASASIMQGQMARNLPSLVGEALGGLTTDAQRAIQFVRSTPGLGVALVGMKQIAHVEENLATASVSPARPEELNRLFRRHT